MAEGSCSPAKAGAEIIGGRDPGVTLAALAQAPHARCARGDPAPGLNSVAAPRLVDADIHIGRVLRWKKIQSSSVYCFTLGGDEHV
jgi:hypothetical protein